MKTLNELFLQWSRIIKLSSDRKTCDNAWKAYANEYKKTCLRIRVQGTQMENGEWVFNPSPYDLDRRI